MRGYFEKYLKIAPFSHALWRATEAEIVSEIEITKPVLDIGCGFGEFGGIFYDSCVEIGIDKSPKDLDIAKTKGVYEKLIVADATNLPLEKETIATCVSISTLEHIKNADEVVKEAYRVLKPGGVFIFTVPTSEINKSLLGFRLSNALGMKSIAKNYVKKYHKIFKHETVVSKQQWENWLTDAGFKKIEVYNTLSNLHLTAFEIFLTTAAPSQILRHLTGNRMVWNNTLRNKLLTWLYYKIKKMSKEKVNESNIAIVARK